MTVPELMQLLAAADERRRSAPAGSRERDDAQREVERLATLIWTESGGELQIATDLRVEGRLDR